MTIGEHIRRYIAENNLSFRSLADKLEMSYAHLNSLANGRKNPSEAVKRRLADFFGVPFEQLDQPGRRVVQVVRLASYAEGYRGIPSALVMCLYSDGTACNKVIQALEGEVTL